MSHEASFFLAGCRGRRPLREEELRMAHPLPLLEEARVRLADERAEEAEHVPELVGLRGLGDRLVERLVELREVPEEDALAPLEAVALHVVREAGERLEHLAPDRLRAHVRARGPRVRGAERVEGAVEEVRERLRVRHLLEARHALLVGDALLLQLARRACPSPGPPAAAGSRPGPRGSTRRRSARPRRTSATPGSSSSSADSAKSESAWWSEKSHWRSSRDDDAVRPLVARGR